MAETHTVIITCAVTGSIHPPSMSPYKIAVIGNASRTRCINSYGLQRIVLACIVSRYSLTPAIFPSRIVKRK